MYADKLNRIPGSEIAAKSPQIFALEYHLCQVNTFVYIQLFQLLFICNQRVVRRVSSRLLSFFFTLWVSFFFYFKPKWLAKCFQVCVYLDLRNNPHHASPSHTSLCFPKRRKPFLHELEHKKSVREKTSRSYTFFAQKENFLFCCELCTMKQAIKRNNKTIKVV